MEKIYNFYVLVASSDIDNIRYVGVTTREVLKRFYGHKYCAMHPEKRELPVHKWMYSHYEKGEDIIVKQIDSCNENNWVSREKYWIKYYEDLGFKLLNISEGGNGVVTEEMCNKSSIQRSAEGHLKAIIALNKDGTFYKEFNSIIQATKELKLKSKSAISNVLKGRSKSSGGYLWVYKKDYKPNESYTYNIKSRGIKIYQFDINGIFIAEYPSKRYFDSLKGWSFNGVLAAIREKRVYHDSYWAETKTIDIDSFEPYYLYKETTETGLILELYHTQIEICDKYKLSPSNVCINIKNNLAFPNGNYISKL